MVSLSSLLFILVKGYVAMEGKFKCEPVGGETRLSADGSCGRLVAFEAILAANFKTHAPIKKASKNTRTRLVA
jgi:hypothetical protein